MASRGEIHLGNVGTEQNVSFNKVIPSQVWKYTPVIPVAEATNETLGEDRRTVAPGKPWLHSEFLRGVNYRMKPCQKVGGVSSALQCVLGSVLGIPHGLIHGNSTITLLGRQSHYLNHRKGNQDTEI